MAAEWHYSKEGQEFGPISSSELKALAVSGRLSPTDAIWKNGMTERRQAGSVKGLFSPPQSSSSSPKVVPITETNAATQGPQSATKQSFLETAKDAAQLTRFQAERTKITQLELPQAYMELGKVTHSNETFRRDFASHFDAIDALKKEIHSIEANASSRLKPESLSDRAKAAAGAAKDMAQTKFLELKSRQPFVELGKAVFEKYGSQPIQKLLDRLAILDSEIAVLSESKSGQFITTKRVAISGIVLVLVFGLFLANKLFSVNKLVGGPSITGLVEEQNEKVLPPKSSNDTIAKNQIASAQPEPSSFLSKFNQQQLKAISNLHKLGARVFFDLEKTTDPAFSVFFAGGRIRGSDLDALSQLDGIEELDIEGTKVTDISYLSVLNRLKVLHLPEELDLDQFVYIKELRNLESLSASLSDSSKGYEGELARRKTAEEILAFISNLKSIQHLNLKHRLEIEKLGLSSLANLPKLKLLQIEKIKVSDGVIETLEGLNIETLVIATSTGTGDVSADGFAQLKKCPSLREIDIYRLDGNIFEGAMQIPNLKKLSYHMAFENRAGVTDSQRIQHKSKRPDLELVELKQQKFTFKNRLPKRKWGEITKESLDPKPKVKVPSRVQTPSKEELYLAAANNALSRRMGTGPTPEQFIAMANKPDEDEILDLPPTGKKGRVLSYGSERVTFLLNDRTGKFVLISCTIDGEHKSQEPPE